MRFPATGHRLRCTFPAKWRDPASGTGGRVQVLERSSGGVKLSGQGRYLPGEEFRRQLGLRSTTWHGEQRPRFNQDIGYGHRGGLCQYGADAARARRSFHPQHYYTG